MEEYYTCQGCSQQIPLLNKTIHDIRCNRFGSSNRFRNVPSSVQKSTADNNEENEAAHNNDNNVPLIDLTASSAPLNSWQCEACTYLNHSMESSNCEICGNVRYSSFILPRVGEEDDSDDYHDQCSTGQEWNCSSCTYINENNSDSCAVCGTARPPRPSIRDTLISSENDSTYFVEDDDADNSSWSRDSGQSSLVSSALLGAGVGAGLALLRGFCCAYY